MDDILQTLTQLVQALIPTIIIVMKTSDGDGDDKIIVVITMRLRESFDKYILRRTPTTNTTETVYFKEL